MTSPLKLTAYVEKHEITDFIADAIGHIAGEWPLIILGHSNSEFGTCITELYSLTAGDHAAAV